MLSHTNVAPTDDHGICVGSRSAKNFILVDPFITRDPDSLSTSTVPAN